MTVADCIIISYCISKVELRVNAAFEHFWIPRHPNTVRDRSDIANTASHSSATLSHSCSRDRKRIRWRTHQWHYGCAARCAFTASPQNSAESFLVGISEYSRSIAVKTVLQCSDGLTAVRVVIFCIERNFKYSICLTIFSNGNCIFCSAFYDSINVRYITKRYKYIWSEKLTPFGHFSRFDFIPRLHSLHTYNQRKYTRRQYSWESKQRKWGCQCTSVGVGTAQGTTGEGEKRSDYVIEPSTCIANHKYVRMSLISDGRCFATAEESEPATDR